VYPSLCYSNGIVGLAWAENNGNYELFTGKSYDNGLTWVQMWQQTWDLAISYYPTARLDSTGVYFLLAWADTRSSWYDIYFAKKFG
jgi:hypothetical protein